MGKVATVNPSKKRSKRRSNPSKPARRRSSRRRNPMGPIVSGLLGFAGGSLVGAGASVGLRYTSLSPMVRGGILLGTGLVAGIGLSLLSPAIGAGVGAGLGAGGGTDMILELTAPKAAAASASTGALSEVRAELGEVRVALGKLMGAGANRVNLLTSASRNRGAPVQVSEAELLAHFG
jgi:hypothetical protein